MESIVPGCWLWVESRAFGVGRRCEVVRVFRDRASFVEVLGAPYSGEVFDSVRELGVDLVVSILFEMGGDRCATSLFHQRAGWRDSMGDRLDVTLIA